MGCLFYKSCGLNYNLMGMFMYVCYYFVVTSWLENDKTGIFSDNERNMSRGG